MTDVQRQPWDQLPDESIRAYRRFCIYLAMGPARTVNAAYQTWRKARDEQSEEVRKSHSSAGWMRDSARFNWPDRAAAYDIAHVAEAGRNAVLAFVGCLDEAARQSLGFLQERSRRPKTWKELMDGIDALGDFIPAETVEAIQALAKRGGVPGIGAAGERAEKPV